jgi:hypothetical protein
MGFFINAQDKIYLVDGECLKGKVTEISDHKITFEANDPDKEYMQGTQVLYKSNILLIEYKNGKVELFSTPTDDIIYTPDKNNSDSHRDKNLNRNPEKTEHLNLGSLNTLALCNADISGFYERLTNTKRFGFGVMGAYNFNQYASFPNLFIAVLYNAKKNYDLGGFINYYPTHFKGRNAFYYGIMCKYTYFRFTSVSEQKSGTTSILTYSPATGSQLATMFTFGSHLQITKDFFIKTIIGIGGFKLHGVYKEQYNYVINQGVSNSNTSTLAKVYFGLNAGFTF